MHFINITEAGINNHGTITIINSPWNTEEELADMLSHNEDDKPEAPNRTSEPPLLLLKKHSVKLQVVSLISNYEYHGALQLVSSNDNDEVIIY